MGVLVQVEPFLYRSNQLVFYAWKEIYFDQIIAHSRFFCWVGCVVVVRGGVVVVVVVGVVMFPDEEEEEGGVGRCR